MKKLKIGIIFLCLALGAYAQDSTKTKTKVNMSVDIVSSLVWRGGVSCKNPNISPTIIVTKKNWEFVIFGSTDFLGTYREVDYTLSYSIKNLKLSVSDYNWYLTQNYFDVTNRTTQHILEGSLNYKISNDFPLNISVNTFFFGSDKKFDTISLNPKNNYSTYLELSYEFKTIKVFVGATPHDGYYGDYYGNKGGFSFCNIGAQLKKDVKISDFILPIKTMICINPQVQNIFATVTLTL